MSDVDWREVAQTMAADNARLCGRLLTAEAVVEQARKLLQWEKSRTKGIDMGGAGPYHFRPSMPHNDLTIAINAHDAGKPS